LLSDIREDLKRVEESLSGLSSHLGYIMIDGTDAKSKLCGLEGNVNKLERDVRKIRRKLECTRIP
jgi:hypothetical protein